METPLNDLVDPSAGFEQPPDNGHPGQQNFGQQGQQEHVQQMSGQGLPVVGGPGQGQSVVGNLFPFKKELFGSIKSEDIFSTILVFAILLLVNFGAFTTVLRSVPSMVGIDGRFTAMGAVVVSIVLALIYFGIKVGAKI